MISKFFLLKMFKSNLFQKSKKNLSFFKNQFFFNSKNKNNYLFFDQFF